MTANPTPSVTPQWQQQLAATYFVNSVAISADGSRVVAGTFYHNYLLLSDAATRFGVYCFDGSGNALWSAVQSMYEGVYWVALSADGSVAAGGGWQTPQQGFLAAYDASTGAELLNFTGAQARVSAVALSHDGSSLLAYAGQTIYLFVRAGAGAFNGTPSTLQADAAVEAIALSPGGDWLAACDLNGTVYFAPISNGAIGTSLKWSASSPSTMHSVAAAVSAPVFAAGGDDHSVYIFSADPAATGLAPTASFDVGGAIRWVALSADASLMTAVCNVATAGTLTAMSLAGGALSQLWQAPLTANPNCTSLDAAGTLVAAADGYRGPGNFYLFDGKTGNQIWCFSTSKMNWPIFTSSTGAGIAGGSDDGALYYFAPNAASSPAGNQASVRK